MVGPDPNDARGRHEAEATERHDAEGHGVYSVANLVTLLRLLIVPFFFAVLVSGSERSRLAAFGLYALAASTDWVDGQIARRTHTVTELGKVIDPLVDRLLLASGVIGLYVIGVLPLWIPALLVARDVYLLYGSWVLEHKGVRLPVVYIGKVTTAVLLAGFSSLIANWPLVPSIAASGPSWLPGTSGAEVPLGIYFVYVGIVLSLITAGVYTSRARAAAHALARHA
ncbi:CDP-alcohol phosphatidyltransferase family protein [Coriobacteriia bacterium Es71-Z0120]|uniref:CDP-alcohol phosphatidyltransferase family protein n=1 Tax=Parvivirga hydrogeniphila TaxID=2939460 RepID=UPI0022608E5F|nr:CDP-alcohol phosphatidyltransferase family protein [Parvivirga hydrogeniphila]MCL4079712.1 CDP-alcohol phosphatidyltransferase family protein [Parvivirga hydrogeniphila]